MPKYCLSCVEGLLFVVVWSSVGLCPVGWVGLWVQSFQCTMGCVGLEKLDLLVYSVVSASYCVVQS